MKRLFKFVMCALLGLAAFQRASAFSIYGPAETSWQTPQLDYITRFYYGDTEIGAPKVLGEGSRLNVPILTYAYDFTFLDFFGTQGVAAVDAAMNELNAMPAASSPRLAHYLTQGNQAINYTARALSLTDLKSTVMGLMLEHEGLIGETHVWDLHTRVPQVPTCFFIYLAINRNYDPVTYDPTEYVNGVQYGYTIWDGCTNGIQVADAIEQPVDQTSSAQFAFTAVATLNALQVGGYYLGMTRDDVGGISYLYRKSNFTYGTLDSNSIVSGSSLDTWAPVNTNNAAELATNNFQGVFGGVEKITYVKVSYDSQIGQFFAPITYKYAVSYVTNGRLQTLQVTRTIIRPDIVFAAGDLVGPPFAAPLTYAEDARGFNFIASPAGSLGANTVIPGGISPQEVVTFNNVTPVNLNYNPFFLDSTQVAGYPILLWGSFSGKTNAPIVFPNGSSITALEQQVVSGQGSAINLGTWNPVSILGTNTNGTTTTAGGL